MGVQAIQIDSLRGVSTITVEGINSDIAFCHPEIKGLKRLDTVNGVIELEISDNLTGHELDDLKKQVASVVDMSVKSFRFVEQLSPLWHHESGAPYHGSKAVKAFSDQYTTELGPGQYAFHGPAGKLFVFFCNRIKRLAEDMKAEIWHLPSIEMSQDLIPQTGYFSSHPQLVTFGYRLPPHYEKIRSFADIAKVKKLSAPEDNSMLEPTGFILEPVVCHNVYRSLKNHRLAQGRIITAEGRCYRYEGFRFAPLLRQWEYSMREVVLVGEGNFVQTARLRCLELTQAMVDELDITADLEVATDPFFVSAAATARTFQMMQSTKMELRLRIDEGESTAGASFNLHSKHFTEPMNIYNKDGNVVETACVGWGIERWMAAFVARWSENPAKWPIPI
ncbi:MAG: hypothetical protein HZA10_04185 [Nitrospirae bacterium]|nr:hypothetical protein [Nitrospirota bacterium]